MNFIKNSWKNMVNFFRGTIAYFRDVLLMHGFMLFILLPFLASCTRYILKRGQIDYLSYETIPMIFSKHPAILIALVLIIILLLTAVFFEFTFLLLSVYFIKKKRTISLALLLKGTLLQLKKIRLSTVLFFLFYFFLILPISGLGFNSDILAKIKIPAFIMDFIFENRVAIIALVVALYLLFFYLAIRMIFVLPEMILKDFSLRVAVKNSWIKTKKIFFKFIGQFAVISGSILLFSAVGFSVIFGAQYIVEQQLPEYSLVGAVISMTLLQFTLLLNIIFSTVTIFYITINFMDSENLLPSVPSWYEEKKTTSKKEWTVFKVGLFVFAAVVFGIGVGAYNINYLSTPSLRRPLTISHRGVDNSNGVQNTLNALEKTNQEHPNYVEMDIQETKDKQFVVMHDFKLKKLTGTKKRPNELTLEELKELTVKENGKEEPICSFDEYLAKAKELNQKLLIEIKATSKDSPDMIDRFISQYRDIILEEGHIIHTLTFDIAQELKEKEPEFYVGYILPFNIVGTPISKVDFFTMEYSTLNRSFINTAHADGKKVYAWTVNDEDAMTRMMFYGVDGIITDQLKLLNETITEDSNEITYSDKLLHFVIGIG
ncbi:glycerophosphoryl diester phosphodiesterase membrane domain-containing protein [Enterococcus sp. LJL99]